MKHSALFLTAGLLAACGGQSLATDSNRPGNGSFTMQVDADITATQTATGPMTSFSVDLEDGLGQAIAGANVVIRNDDAGDIPLVEASPGSGRYVNSKTQFFEGDFHLEVTRGDDRVRDVTVGNPGPHTVSAPAANATVTANQPLALTWTTPVMAKSVSIDTRDFGALAPDTGAFTIPADENPARAAQRLRVHRMNEVEIAGGLAGSRFSVTYTAVIDPYVVQ
jgi:hypothetical protein